MYHAVSLKEAGRSPIYGVMYCMYLYVNVNELDGCTESSGLILNEV